MSDPEFALIFPWLVGGIIAMFISKEMMGETRSEVTCARGVLWPLWLLLTIIRGVRHL